MLHSNHFKRSVFAKKNSTPRPRPPVLNYFRFFQHCCRKYGKKLYPSMVRLIICLSANACGRRLSLHFIALQDYTSFHLLTFHSVHCQPQPRQPTQECFLHSIALRPTRRFIPLPFVFSTHNPELRAKTWNSISPTPFATFHSVYTLAFPNPVSGMPNRIVCSWKQEAKKFRVLTNGTDEKRTWESWAWSGGL